MSKLRILIGQTINAEAGVSYTVLVQQHIPSFLNPFVFLFFNRASKTVHGLCRLMPFVQKQSLIL